MSNIKFQLKTDKDKTFFFVQGPNGEIIQIQAVPGAETPIDPMEYKQERDAILNNNRHLTHPQDYDLIKEVSSKEGELLGLPELSGLDLVKHDLRNGIVTATMNALRDYK